MNFDELFPKWEQKLLENDYTELPETMETALEAFFLAGGTSNIFNESYQFGSNDYEENDVIKLVEQLYYEIKGIK